MKFKRLLCVVLVCIFVGCMIPSAAFAVDPEVIEVGEQAGVLIYDLYGAANNTSLAFDSIQPGPALTEIITLYQEAHAEAGGDPVSMTALGTALLAAGAIGVVYDAGEAIYQLAVNLDYSNFGEFYQDFNNGWDYILSDIAGFVRDQTDGLFHWSSNNDVVAPSVIYSNLSLLINGNALQNLPITVVQSSTNLSTNWENNGTTNPVFAYACSFGSGYRLVVVSQSNSIKLTYTDTNTSTNTVNTGNANYTGTAYSGSPFYYKLINSPNSSAVMNCPIYSINNSNDYDPWHVFGTYSSSDLQYGNIDIRPSTYIGDPLQNPLEISIPNPSVPMTDPIRIGTNIEVDPQLLPDSIPADPVPGTYYPITDPTALNDIVPEAWEDVVSDGVEVETETVPDNPGPGPGGSISEVFTPLLPTTLPSFDFNFSSIWYYVREWVASLRSFFSVLFSVWAALPYAIVVPVYASAVIVIVLGVYKRFFG